MTDATDELAVVRIRVALDAFDIDVADHLANETERADLWEEIEVNVTDLRALLARLEAAEARADEWKAAYGQACDDYAAIVKQTIVQKAENARLAAELAETEAAHDATCNMLATSEAELAEARKIVEILDRLDPENAIDDAVLRDLHARLQRHGEKYPERAVSVLHRNVVLYTIQATARAWHERNG